MKFIERFKQAPGPLFLKNELREVAAKLVPVRCTICLVVLRDALIGANKENVGLDQTRVVQCDQVSKRRVQLLDLAGFQVLSGQFGGGFERAALFGEAVPVILLSRVLFEKAGPRIGSPRMNFDRLNRRSTHERPKEAAPAILLQRLMALYSESG